MRQVVRAYLGALVMALAVAPGAWGQDFDPFGTDTPGQPAVAPEVTVSAKAARDQVAPASDLPVAIVFDMQPGWHIWPERNNYPTDHARFEDAQYTSIEVRVDPPAAMTAHPGFIQWPPVHGYQADLGAGPAEYASHDGRAIAYLPVTVADDATPGTVEITLRIDYQACNDRTCLQPETVERTITVQIVPPAEAATLGDVDDPDFADFPPDIFGWIRSGAKPVVRFDLFGIVTFSIDPSGAGLILLLLVAALGGFLLNLTPCVLPVIPIKIMALSAAGQGSRMRTLALGVVMAIGVVSFWLLLGVLIASLSNFTATNQLFQYPVFTIGVGLFIAFMAVAMCGLFALQLPQKIYLFNPNHETLPGSFLFGVMAAVLSTPCTAPFMGAAAAWAATEHSATTLSVFGAIGGGMAFPYLVLAAFPKLVDRMPRTGPASELIKQVMGLLMLAAAAYFVGVGISGLLASPPDPPSRMYWWVVAIAGIGAGLWLAWRTLRIARRVVPKVAFTALGLLITLISLAIGVRMTDRGPIDWVYYTPERFDAALDAGDVVVMEFTAEWCLNCKALEEGVLHRPTVVALLNGEGVAPIKVDLTGKNTAGNAMLGRVNRLTIPLLVIFRPEGDEAFKGDFYTVEQVVEAVEEAKGG